MMKKKKERRFFGNSLLYLFSLLGDVSMDVFDDEELAIK